MHFYVYYRELESHHQRECYYTDHLAQVKLCWLVPSLVN